MTAMADALSTALLHSLWQNTAIAALLWVTLAALRRQPAQVKYVVACVGLAAMVAMPAVTMAAVYRASQPTQADDVTVARVLSTVAARAPYAEASATGAPVPARGESFTNTLRAWALPIWFAGVLAFSLRGAGAGMHARTIRRQAHAADEGTVAMLNGLARRLGVHRRVWLKVGDAIDGPATLGWLRPVILLPPATVLGVSPPQLEALLAHELAHIRRHDYLVNAIQMVIETLIFYHPAVWWASSRIRAERELCCDDVAVDTCGDAVDYAHALARVARYRVSNVRMALGATGGPLLRRIQRILAGHPGHPSPAWAAPGLVLLLIAAGVVLARAQSQLPGTISPAPPQETVLRGQIVDAGSGAPVSGMLVRANHVTGIPPENRMRCPIDDCNPPQGRGEHPNYYTTADASGRFEIRGLKTGEYLVSAGGHRYLTRYFGQQGDNMPEATVFVAPGVTADHVDIRVARAARITGRVIDGMQRGIAGVELVLLRSRYEPGGARPVGVVFSLSEDDGKFEFPEVPPGDYYIRASAPDGVRPVGRDGKAIYATSYFPSATALDDAQVVAIGSGQELAAIDITLGLSQLHSISGRLIDPSGQPLSGASVRLMPPPPDGIIRLRSDVTADGRFRIEDVPPGTYTIMVSERAVQRRWTPKAVTVAEDVPNVQLVAGPGVSARGRITADGGRALPFDASELMLALESPNDTGGFRMSAGTANIAPDGTFALDSDAGVMSLQIRSVPRGWFVKSTTLDGVDVTDQLFDLAPGVGARSIDVVLTNRGGQLAGRVSDRMGRTVENALVVIFPADRTRWTTGRLMQTTFSHQLGRFDFGTIPAADYRVVAVPALPRGAWTDPDVLDRLWSDSTAVRVQEDERRALDLRVAPAPEDLVQ